MRNLFRVKLFSGMADSLQNRFPERLKAFIESFLLALFFENGIRNKVCISLGLCLMHESKKVFIHLGTAKFYSVNRAHSNALIARKFNGLYFEYKLRVFHLIINF